MVAAPWQNGDGLTVKFPTYYKDPGDFVNRPRIVQSTGSVKEIVIDYDLSLLPAGTTSYTSDLNNDGTLDGFNSGDVYFPANASVISARLIASTAAVGGTSITLGTYLQNGTAIAATGLITATEGVIANFNAAGKRVPGAGSLVSVTAGTAGVGTADAFIGLTTTGTFTAGTGQITIFYTEPVTDVL